MPRRVPKSDLTQELVRCILAYNPDTGIFTWRVALGRRRRAGAIAGSVLTAVSGELYWRVKIDGKSYAAHRLAWLYVYGVWPEHEIDHINMCGLDNRISNLREATLTQNMRNRKVKRISRTGIKGVHRHGNKWIAAICVDRRRIRLGSFSTPQAASAAYAQAAQRFHAEFARAA